MTVKQIQKLADGGSPNNLFTDEQINYVASISDNNLRSQLLHQVRLRDNIEADRNAFEKECNVLKEKLKAAMLQGIKIDFPEHGKIILTDKDGNTYTSKSEELIDFFHGASNVIPMLQNKGEWISVEERLPTEDGFYIVHSTEYPEEDIHVLMAAWNKNHFEIWVDRPLDKVTHWQEMPAPPEQTVTQ